MITAHNPPPASIALMLTRRCNMSCSHCSVESSPAIKSQPNEKDLVAAIRQAAAAGVRVVQLTGGEPFLRPEVLYRLLHECRRLGVGAAVFTNGTWAKTRTRAEKTMAELERSGLRRLVVSYDRYHAEYAGPEILDNLAALAPGVSFSVAINVVRQAEDDQLEGLVSGRQDVPNMTFRFYDLQAVGRAREFSAGAFSPTPNGPCSGCCIPAITDDGRLTACNGPSYFCKEDSPLVLGRLDDQPLSHLLDHHGNDPYLEAIRTIGPSGLRLEWEAIQKERARASTPGDPALSVEALSLEALPVEALSVEALPVENGLELRASYRSLCDLCLHLASDREAVSALRSRLAKPGVAAHRLAHSLVLSGQRRRIVSSGNLPRRAATARLLLALATQRFAADIEHQLRLALDHPGTDWSRLALYVESCGVAHLIHPHRDLLTWAPRFFTKEIGQAAFRTALQMVKVRAALQRLDAHAAEIGAPILLLKGAATLARAPGNAPIRAPGDIDLWVDAERAAEFRARLLAADFTGIAPAARTAPHHLAPVSFRGVAVEIHQRIMPRIWGLPERAWIREAQPIPGYDHLQALAPEAFGVHALVHCSSHVFAQGLKTAFDLNQAWGQGSPGPLDGQRVRDWVAASRTPLAFWVPYNALVRHLGLELDPVLVEGIGRPPNSPLARRLTFVAERRLFNHSPGPQDLNPFTKVATFVLLQRSWRGRLSALGRLFSRDEREARHTNDGGLAASWRQRQRQLGDAWREYRAYRRARAMAAGTE